MAWRSRSVAPVWLAALIGAVVVGLFAGSAYLTWIPIVLALSMLLGFVIQLALQRKEGLVERLAASATGALVILAVATGVIALIRLS